MATRVPREDLRGGTGRGGLAPGEQPGVRGHPEQSGWDLTTLRRREREPWFDPAGLLLVEDDDGLAGSCWTKLHPPGDVGEIYVIAVDPDRQGLGLGRALTLSGLASLAERGATTGMLFVDGANTAALRLYDSLGFALARLDRAYVGEVRP
ncbi:MAG: GNAT family N-acetyltransferase [Acidimicrobiia bacterium]|nr:GNAT family N-acetyltransferase [Acidimicrobiia bacterium]